MKKLSTPTLCLLLTLLGIFAVMSDSSRAAADSWKHESYRHGYDRHGYDRDDDHEYGDRRYKRYHAHQHFGKHRHKHRAHRHHRHGTAGTVVIVQQAGYPLSILPGEAPDWRARDWRAPDGAVPRTGIVDIGGATASGPCREYTATARIGGRKQQIYGQACRQPDGAWTPVR